MIKLLASDIDGTIIDKDNKIAPSNMEAIKKLNNLGINFTICTGKTYLMEKDFCKKINATYGIFGNGTQIINLKTGKEILRNVLSKRDIEKCLQIANKNNLHVHIYTDDKIIAQDELKYMAYRNYLLYGDNIKFEIVKNLNDYLKLNNMSIFKLIISGENNLIKVKNELLENQNISVMQIKKYNNYKDRIINKEYEYLDIIPKNVNKYNSLKQLCNYLNIRKDETMAIGDNINDIDMIKNAKIGVAIAGSYEEVKNEATYVTKNSAKDRRLFRSSI